FKNGGAVTVTGVVAYNGATAYVPGNLASSGGVNYYCIAATTGNAPPNATYWYAMPAGNLLEIPHPFVNNDLFRWTQNGRVITLTHPDVRPQELEYFGLQTWTVTPITTAPSITQPLGLAAVAGAAGTRSISYVVTAVKAETYEESIAGAIFQLNVTAEGTPAAPIALTWTPKAGAVEYNVYADPYQNGTFGYIGTATGAAAFKDIGFIPDFAITPPLARALFATTDNYPATCAHHQQRRMFGYTDNVPDAVYGSRVGFPSNFAISSPLQDDDAISFRIAGKTHQPVRHLVGLKQLIVLTDGGAFTIGQPQQPLTPSTLASDQQTYVGAAADPAPVIVGNAILYVQARGKVLHDLRFDVEVEGLAGRDLLLYAAHLTEGLTLDAMDFQQTPHSTVWCCRSDGALLGLTYIRDQEVWGWHRHDTGASGRFLDVCVVPEATEDAPYFIVRRTIGGAFVRMIERLEPREIVDFNTDAFFVDAGLTYSGAPATNIAGLGHLNGQVVAVVADGNVIYDGNPAGANAAAFTVTGGTLPTVLATPASVIHAGLPIRYAEIETLDLDVQGSDVRDKKKRVASVSLLLRNSARSLSAGPDSSNLVQLRLEPYDVAQDEFTGRVEVVLQSAFGDEGRVFIRHTDPLPITIVGIIPNVTVGG
ncbi:MAG TPA: hypothetical protein VK506_16660, partial [Conexibacter sp.]|nr:hypothetical protein [Conexibacter sp.]